MDFISVSGVAKIGGWLKAADRDVELTTMNNSTGKDRHCWKSAAELAEWTVVVEHSETWDKLNFFTFCWVFLVLDKLFYWINVCKPWSHDFGKAGRREKAIRIFSLALVKKIVSGFWLVIRYFSLVRKVVWPMRLLLIKERLILFGEFALSLSQYFYNKYELLPGPAEGWNRS